MMAIIFILLLFGHIHGQLSKFDSDSRRRFDSREKAKGKYSIHIVQFTYHENKYPFQALENHLLLNFNRLF